MRKLFFLLLLAFFSSFSYAQYFTLVPSGFVSTADETKSYIVFEFPGQSKEDLYNTALVYFNQNFVSAKHVISKVKNETITISALSSKKIKRNGLSYFRNYYSVVISFQAGKVKVDAPICRLKGAVNGHAQTLHVYYAKTDVSGFDVGIYGKKGKVKSKPAIAGMNDFANGFVIGLKSGFERGIVTEDW